MTPPDRAETAKRLRAPNPADRRNRTQKGWELEILDYSEGDAALSPQKSMSKRAEYRRKLVLDLRTFGCSRKDIAAHLGTTISVVDRLRGRAAAERDAESRELVRQFFGRHARFDYCGNLQEVGNVVY